jgi:hypothetical protein
MIPAMNRFLLAAWLLAAAAIPGPAQNVGALQFFGSGDDSAPNRDRVNIAIDDNAAGAASTLADVGAASFTIEWWMRGDSDLNTSSLGGWTAGASNAGIAWTEGNVIVDRDIYTTADQSDNERDFGVSILGGHVAFGTGFNDGAGADTEATLISNGQVLTSAGATWFHIAVTRNAATGAKAIYVNGVLDISSTTHPSNDDLSFPDAGLTNNYSAFNNYLVLGAEKHDYPGSNYYAGTFDELRLWTVARTGAEIAADYQLAISGTTAGLAGYWRFEELSGTTVGNDVAGSPAGQLIANTAGNGLRVYASSDPSFVAPLIPEPSAAAFLLVAAAAAAARRRKFRRD